MLPSAAFILFAKLIKLKQVVELALISFWFYFSGGIVFKMIYSLTNELIAIKFPSGSAT